jgi:hypothetical protein
MFSRLSTALRQQLLTTSFLLSSALGFSAFGQQNTTPDTTQWNAHYNILKTQFFIGKDTTVNAQSIWNKDAAIPASTIGQQQFYSYLQQKAAQDSYTLNVQTFDKDGKPVQNLYNTIDSTLTKQAQTGVSLGRQNATLIKALNFDGQAWPEFTMAKYVVMSAPHTTLNKNTQITYQTLVNQSKETAQSKPDYTKAAVLLQILSGMTEKPDQMSDAAYKALKTKAHQLQTRHGLSAASTQAEIFKKAVDTHHHLIQKPVIHYVTQHQAALNRVAPALATVPAHVKKVVPDIAIKNRTSDPQHQMRESVAGFYQLVGHDAYDLLNALQQGKGNMLLSDFYKANPRYNKKPGRAAQRAQTVLSKALLKPYHNAGYTNEFAVDKMLKTYTVAHACYDGTQRLSIPAKPTHGTILNIAPAAKPEPLIVTDTVNVEKRIDSTVVIERSKPYGSFALGTDHWTHETFGSDFTNRENGSLVRRNGLSATLNLQHDFAGSKFMERNQKTFYKQGFFAIGTKLSAHGGRHNFDRRDDYYNQPAEQTISPISTYWGGTSGAHVRVGPITGFTDLGYTKNPVTDKLSVTYGASLNLAGFIGKKGGVHTVGIESRIRDANLRWNNGGNLLPRSEINPMRAASQNSVTYSWKKGAFGLQTRIGVNDTYITDHSPLSKEYLKTATQIGRKDSFFATIGASINLGGTQKRHTVVKTDGVTTDSTTVRSHITPLERALLTNYRRTANQNTQKKDMKKDTTVVDSNQPKPVFGAFQNQYHPGQ